MCGVLICILLIFSVEPGGTVSFVLRVIFRLRYQRSRFSAESCSRQFLIQHYFVDLLELGQGEIFGHQVEGQIGIIQLSSEALKGICQNAGMVESERTGV